MGNPLLARPHVRRRIVLGTAVALPVVVTAAVTVALVNGGGTASAATVASTTSGKACLTRTDLTNRRYVRTNVDWRRGIADVITTLPLCRGVQLKGAGAAYAFTIGARPAGHGHPNVPRWPQVRVHVAGWQALSGAAGAHHFRFPPVVDQCTQTDVAIWTQGWPAGWPAGLARPGLPQPRSVAFNVGNSRGCFPPPRVAVGVTCRAASCDGTARTTFTIRNPGRYAVISGITLVADGHRVATLAHLAVRPGQSLRVTTTLRDGPHQYRLRYALRLGRSTQGTVAGRFDVHCPPGAHIEVRVTCLCGAKQSGVVTDRISTRYRHVVTVTSHSGTVLGKVTVPPRSSRTITVRWAASDLVRVLIQNQLGPHNTNVGGPVLAGTV